MSTRKNKSRNKSSAKKSLFKENTEDRGLPKQVKESDVKKSKSVRSKQTGLDSFTILKKAGETLQDDISEESFNPPLHSTAVYTEDEDLLERTKGSLEKSSNQASIGPSASQKKSVKQRNKSQKDKTASSVKSSLTPRNVPGKKRKTSQKPATPEQDLEASKKDKSSEHEEEETGSTHNKTSPAEQATANV